MYTYICGELCVFLSALLPFIGTTDLAAKMTESQMSNESSSSENEFDSNCDAGSLENVETRIGIVFQQAPAVIECLLKSLSDWEVANCTLVCKLWRIYAKKILHRRERRMCICLFDSVGKSVTSDRTEKFVD